MKKGKFAFRLWFVRVLIESLMKSKIDEYEGDTMIARRTKTTMTMGYVIGSGLINALSQLHSEIKVAENPRKEIL